MTYRTFASRSVRATAAGLISLPCMRASLTPWAMSSAVRGRRMTVGSMVTFYQTGSIHPDVLIPQRRVLADELGHHLDALGVVQVDDLDAACAHEVGRLAPLALAAGEVDGFADDHLGHAELHGGAGAQVAGHQRGVEDGVGVGPLAAGVGEAVDFGVGHRIAVLHPAVVPAADDLVAADEDRADGQAALGKAFPGFVDGGAEEGVHGVGSLPAS